MIRLLCLCRKLFIVSWIVVYCLTTASAGLLSPRVQWPQYYPQYPSYWGNQQYPQYQQPYQQQRRSRDADAQKKADKTKPKPQEKREKQSDETTSTKQIEKSTSTDNQPQELESANPLHRPVRKVQPSIPAEASEAAAGPAQRAAAPQNITGEYVAIVWDDSDSLQRIASASGVSTAELLRINALRSGELQDGQVLRVPKPAGELPSLNAFNPDKQKSREVWRGIRGQKRVALTFDAGGEDESATDLVNYLQQAKAPATFFVTGEFVSDHPKLVKELASIGPVHNHSWSHPEFTKIPDDKIAEELERTDWAIRDATGKSSTPYWRPPFGDRDGRVLRLAAAAGFQSIYWTLDSLDSVGEKKDPDFIVQRILNPPKADGDPESYLDGAIILMHVGESGTARAVPVLIKALRDRGFQLVTVDELLDPNAGVVKRP